MQLRGLPNTRKIRRCEHISSAAVAVTLLRCGIAGTTANDYGAINVWNDWDGKYRCESMRHFVTLESKTFTSLTAVRKWVSVWLRNISTGDYEQVPAMAEGKETGK